MVSSARRAIACVVLVVIGAVICVQAQTATQKAASASISGKVTLKDKPVAGLTIAAREANESGSSSTTSYSARTDQNGSYRITNLRAGTYEVSAMAPALVSTNQTDSVVVSDGEEVEDVNIQFVRGGVITGKVTDSDGQPLIEQLVRITPVLERAMNAWSDRALLPLFRFRNSTDDRGVYRVFGLPPGKYKVSVGDSGSGRRSFSEYYKETFYPSVTDAAKATIIEVTEGSEATNVDIVMGRALGTFKVVGRVVDGETGKPVPHIRYGVGQRIGHGESGSSSSVSMSNDVTNANGEFHIENVTPGKYTIFTVAPEGNGQPAASVTFDVIDRDVTDVIIKTTKGGSLSGVVVLDVDQRMPAKLQICAQFEGKVADFANTPMGPVGQDGTFRLEGVQSGLARLSLCANDNDKHFEILRVERNGIPQPDTIAVKEREHVAGLRVFVKYVKLTGAIRGQLKVEKGELPPVSQLTLILWPLDENLEPLRSHSIPSPQLSARGRFLAEKLPAGSYRISVWIVRPGRPPAEMSQQAIVNDDTVTEVTLTLKP